MNGVVNIQNVKIRGTECPEEHILVDKNNPGVITWLTVSKEHKIVSYVSVNVNSADESYRNMLTNNDFSRFGLFQQDYIFQRDSAPPHYASRKSEFWN